MIFLYLIFTILRVYYQELSCLKSLSNLFNQKQMQALKVKMWWVADRQEPFLIKFSLHQDFVLRRMSHNTWSQQTYISSGATNFVQKRCYNKRVNTLYHQGRFTKLKGHLPSISQKCFQFSTKSGVQRLNRELPLREQIVKGLSRSKKLSSTRQNQTNPSMKPCSQKGEKEDSKKDKSLIKRHQKPSLLSKRKLDQYIFEFKAEDVQEPERGSKRQSQAEFVKSSEYDSEDLSGTKRSD